MFKEEPLCIFGVLADSQYADIDNCLVYGRTRYYRESLQLVQNAINDWRILEAKTNTKLKFILQLGDIIEGFRSHKEKREDHIKTVLNELTKLNSPIYHCWGNHEVYGLNKDFLIQSELNTSRILNQNFNSNYYYVDVTDKLRLICLDLYEISLYETDPVKLQEIKKIIELYTKMKEVSEDKQEKNYLSRFKAYNGSTSQNQLDWLKEQLNYCKLSNKKVILSGHIPLESQAGDFDGVCWNATEILDLIWSFENLVILYLAGHYHSGGYYHDKKHSIHHLTLNAILETDPNDPNNAYATVQVYNNKIVLRNQKTMNNLSIEI